MRLNCWSVRMAVVFGLEVVAKCERPGLVATIEPVEFPRAEHRGHIVHPEIVVMHQGKTRAQFYAYVEFALVGWLKFRIVADKIICRDKYAVASCLESE